MKSDSWSIDNLPVLPELAQRILEMALQDDVSITQLAGYLEQDQALTLRLLSLANSSYYRRMSASFTVHDAVLTLGLDTVRSFALGLCVYEVFPDSHGSHLDHREFWRHSLATAMFARELMKIVEPALAEKAFCVGILHGVGKIALLYDDCAGYNRVLDEATRSGRCLIDVENELLETNHAEAGRRLLLEWGLPELYAECVWCYPNPIRVLSDDQYQISMIVKLAVTLAGLTYPGSSGESCPAQIMSADLARHGLSPDDLDSLMARVPGEINAMSIEMGLGKPREGLFQIINRASARLSASNIAMGQRQQVSSGIQQRQDCLLRLCRALNSAGKISEVFEMSADALIQGDMALSLALGLKTGDGYLICEAKAAAPARFSRVDEDEARRLIISKPLGLSLPGGLLLYLEAGAAFPADGDAFMGEVAAVMNAALNRLGSGENGLRQALKDAAREKQRAEELLALNRELIESATVGLCLVNRVGRVCLENEASLQLRLRLGIGGSELLDNLKQQTQPEAVSLRDSLSLGSAADICWSQCDRVYRVQVRVVKLSNWRLITSWDQTEDLERQQRMFAYAKMSTVGNLAASMAHNMKSPLGAIHGFASIIREDLEQGAVEVLRDGRPDEDFGDMVRNMVTASENVLEIVNQLLNLSRKWETPASLTPVAAFVDNALRLVSAQAASAQVRFTTSCEVESATFKAPALEQVLINLFQNAINASGPESQIVVRVCRDAGRLAFEVRDQGCGMASDKLARIYDPLFTDWPTKTGMGLGLALVKDIVESLDGEIKVSSTPGQGSTFTVLIPEA